MRSDACDLANEASRFFGGVRALAVTTDRLNKYVAWCREQGYKTVSLHASEDGRHLYEALGFKPTNEMRLGLKQ